MTFAFFVDHGRQRSSFRSSCSAFYLPYTRDFYDAMEYGNTWIVGRRPFPLPPPTGLNQRRQSSSGPHRFVSNTTRFLHSADLDAGANRQLNLQTHFFIGLRRLMPRELCTLLEFPDRSFIKATWTRPETPGKKTPTLHLAI